MTQEEKILLLKDLCARLPYHVNVKVWLTDGTTEEGPLDLEHNYCDVLQDAFYFGVIKDIKPYLRPMSSMTKEEKEEFENLLEGIADGIERWDKPDLCEEYDWLNAHHFDYRGLIPMGLALILPEEMYKK